VIGPADVPVVEGQATIVYAIGSLEGSSLDVLVQTVALEGGAGAGGGAAAGGEAPAGVPAGTGGLVDSSSSIPLALVLASGAGLAVAASGGVALARTRRR
jgi:hypothetical protein